MLDGQLKTRCLILEPIVSGLVLAELERNRSANSSIITERFLLVFSSMQHFLCLISLSFKSYGKDDIIGCFIDLDSLKIKWSKNGKVFDNAYDIQSGLKNYAFFPAVCMKNAEIKFNFGETSFAYPPKVKNLKFSRTHYVIH